MKIVRLFFAIVCVFFVILFGVFIVQYFFPERTVLASISAISVATNEPFHFVDSTQMAQSRLWFFGDGARKTATRGTYKYKKSGKYLIKLIVDNTLTQVMPINVYDKDTTLVKEHAIGINGPTVGFQGEYLLFTAQGDDTYWRWNLGETPGVDYRTAVIIHKYTKPGRYTIRLMSESSKYPALFAVEILPTYKDVDSTKIVNAANNDIKNRLQQIADGKDFNDNYYYLVNKYLCKDEHILVTIDGKKMNDFFSYCMGLKLDNGAVIRSVASEQTMTDTCACVVHINVKQH